MNRLQAIPLPWRLTFLLLLLLLFLVSVGWWRSGGTGPQVQVPMFYDAHYLFPRPWTQAQEAPGAPAPLPLAVYGANQVTQPFIHGADRLVGVEVWLAGPAQTAVTVTLTTPQHGQYAARLPLTQGKAGGWYRLRLPVIPQARGQTFALTLAAPQATAAAPVVTHVVGGDWLGGALRLNEYQRPGNLVLHAYAAGAPGRWWADALGAQLLPLPFRLRLQQYKPPFLQGAWFAGLAWATAVLTLVYLAAAWPAKRGWGAGAGWLGVALLGGLLAWSAGSGRLRLPPVTATMMMPSAVEARPDMAAYRQPRVVYDLTTLLWTAQRLPEPRFVTTTSAPQPAIVTPPQSELRFALDAPRNGRLLVGARASGAEALRFSVWFNETELATAVVATETQQLDIDLAHFAGQGGELRLRTAPVGDAQADGRGYWVQPQLVARADWLLAEPPPEMLLTAVQFGDGVTLHGYAVTQIDGTQWAVTLFWEAQRPLTQPATVFVHWLDAAGQIIAQHDGQPVQNSYPLTAWPTGMLVADTHLLTLPGAPPPGSALGVGLYDPATFARWPAWWGDGTAVGDDRALLPLNREE